MERSRAIIDQHFGGRDELVLGGVPASRIAAEFGTPAYVYDFDVLAATYDRLRARLPERISLFYALKANPSLAIAHWFAQAGAGIELASLGELLIARAAGFSGPRMLFAGPAKTGDELEPSIREGMLSINVESLQELHAIATIAERCETVANISLRVNPLDNVSGSQMKMGGGPSQFGIDEEMLPDLLRVVREHRAVLRLAGLHFYVGSQILDHELALRNAHNSIAVARRVMDASGEALDLLNLGGGLGTAYYAKSRQLDEIALCAGLTETVEALDRDTAFAHTRLILELGRYLVSSCGVFLSRVVYTKESRGTHYAVLDGGMNYCSVATGNLGQTVRRKFPLCVANRLDAPLDREYEIAGPLCTPMDSFGGPFSSPEIEPGDIVAVLLVGAYGFSTSPHGFLSHPGCPEIAVSGGVAQMIRPPREASSFVEGQRVFVMR